MREVLSPLLAGPKECVKNMSRQYAVDRYSRRNSIVAFRKGGQETQGIPWSACCNVTRVVLWEAETPALGFVRGALRTVLGSTHLVLPSGMTFLLCHHSHRHCSAVGMEESPPLACC